LMGGSWLFGGFQTAKLPFNGHGTMAGNTISPGSGGNLWLFLLVQRTRIWPMISLISPSARKTRL